MNTTLDTTGKKISTNFYLHECGKYLLNQVIIAVNGTYNRPCFLPNYVWAPEAFNLVLLKSID